VGDRIANMEYAIIIIIGGGGEWNNVYHRR